MAFLVVLISRIVLWVGFPVWFEINGNPGICDVIQLTIIDNWP